MKKVLFISFDLVRAHDPAISLAIASILATLKHSERLKSMYEFEHLSIDLLNSENWHEKIKPYKLSDYSFVAISAYVWNECIINEFIESLISHGFNGQIILGGYQIANNSLENLKKRYPKANIFVEGYAEQALLDVFTGKTTAGIVKSKLNASILQSPLLTGEIKVKQNAEMIRLETKRGCPYACTFCRHRDVVNNSILELDPTRIMDELDYLLSLNVKKINIIDPIFHIGKHYREILKKIISLSKSKNADTLFSLQCRLEFLARNHMGSEFLNLCKQGNFELEFGLQTCNEHESVLINRRNEMPLIEEAFKMLNESGIRHEISLIYGLPGQTLKSFSEGMDFVRQKSNAIIKTYPLMLLQGTPLFEEKEKYEFKEEKDEFGIPHVVSSNSFTHEEWLKMKTTPAMPPSLAQAATAP
jgi:radical SAM superfamily enzyme YgiQ (UPF0313 family)